MADPWQTMFTDPPRTLRRMGRRHEYVYVPTPTSSLDWYGADWEFPTSLDFTTKVMHREMIGARRTYLGEHGPVHPTELIRDLLQAWAALHVQLADGGMVVDRDERLGFTGEADLPRDQWSLTIRVDCWPAVEGVTVPKRDTTL